MLFKSEINLIVDIFREGLFSAGSAFGDDQTIDCEFVHLALMFDLGRIVVDSDNSHAVELSTTIAAVHDGPLC
jgi:hypothetical protein